MLALLLACAAQAAPDPTTFGFGVSAGLVVASDASGEGAEGAASGTAYGALEVLDIARGEAHVMISGLGGTDGLDVVQVTNRAIDLRVLAGIALPLPIPLPFGEAGVDVLLGPDLRITTTKTTVYQLVERKVRPSVHPSVAVGPWFEVWKARAGLRAWSDLPRDGRFGVSALIGLEL